MGVPHVLHQIWMQGKEVVPSRYDAARKTWKDLHPTWEIHTWSETEMKSLSKGTEWDGLIQLCTTMIQRADIYRCMLLDFYGGVYADMDAYAIEAFDPLCEESRPMLQLGGTKFMPGFRVSNAILLAPPKIPFWSSIFIPAVKHAIYTKTVLDDISLVCLVMRTTGPWLWTRLLNDDEKPKMDGDATTRHLIVHPHRYFYATDIPKTHLLTDHDKLLLRGCFSYHIQDSKWLTSWEGVILYVFLFAQQKPAIFSAVFLVTLIMLVVTFS